MKEASTELAAVIAEWDALSKRISQEIDEFNAGFDAYNASSDLDESESFYRHTHEDIPSHDTFAIGYAWAKFRKELSTQ